MVERHGTDTMYKDEDELDRQWQKHLDAISKVNEPGPPQDGLTDRSSMRYCVECYADLVDDWQACWCFPNPPTLNEPWKKGEKDDS